MKHEISQKNLEKLFEAVHNDSFELDFVCESVQSFADYSQAIFNSEIWLNSHTVNNLPKEKYEDTALRLDAQRTACHNAVLAAVDALNRRAGVYNLPPIYEGEVAKERPIRTEVADAVLAYVGRVMEERRRG